MHSSAPHSCYIPYLSHSPRLDHSNYTWRRVQIKKLLCCATAQAVSRWLPTAAARVRVRVWSDGICGGQSGAGAGFLRVLRFPLPIFMPPNSPSSTKRGLFRPLEVYVGISVSTLSVLRFQCIELKTVSHIAYHTNFTFIFGDVSCEKSVCLSSESSTRSTKEPVGIKSGDAPIRALPKRCRKHKLIIRCNMKCAN
jgi:hypothetical protein